MGNIIAIEQNQEKYIERLAAQRRLYSIAKNIFAAQFALSVLVAFFIYLTIISPQVSLVGAVFTVIIGLLGVTAFPQNISKYKKKAASIQEEIDCQLLRISLNTDLVLTHDPEDIPKYSQKLLDNDKEKESLINWYEGIPDYLTYSAARIICQRCNLNWDIELREFFSLSVKIIAAFIVLIVVYVNRNVVAEKIILNIIVPAFPIIDFTFQQHFDNKNSVKEMKDLKIQLDLLWKDLLLFKFTDNELESRSRLVQNKIFRYRKGNPLIPDWFAKKQKRKQQNIANRTVKQLVKEYEEASMKRCE